MTERPIRCPYCGHVHVYQHDGPCRPVAIDIANRETMAQHGVGSVLDVGQCTSCKREYAVWPAPVDYFEHREKKAAAERAAVVATGLKTIAAVAYSDPRTGASGLTSWVGQTKVVVLTNAPDDCMRFGISRVLVGPRSEIVDVTSANADQVAFECNGVVLTVFTSATPIWPAP